MMIFFYIYIGIALWVLINQIIGSIIDSRWDSSIGVKKELFFFAYWYYRKYRYQAWNNLIRRYDLATKCELYGLDYNPTGYKKWRSKQNERQHT